MKLKTQCELCRSSDIPILYALNTFNVLKCRHCGMVFRDKLLEMDEAHKLYGQDYFTSEQKDYFFDKLEVKERIFQKRLDGITKRHPDVGRILDVGCAIGTFLHIAKKNGWDTTGVDVSVYAAEYARKNYSVDARAGELADQDFPAESFDVITLWDVIDHSETPIELLQHISRLLKKDGILVIQTNMEDSLLYRIAHYIYVLSFGIIRFPVARCHPLHHSTFFSTTTMQTALKHVGFRSIEVCGEDLDPELINTNFFGRVVLKIISFAAFLVKRPHEAVFYSRK